MKNLKQKKVFITGAASGIGRCLAEALSAEGAILLLSDINAAALEKTAETLRAKGTMVYTFVNDVADRAGVEAMAKSILAEHGGIDVLINNAGIGYSHDLAETSLETWQKLININLLGVLYHVYAFWPDMMARRRGHIINVSSGQAFFRMPGWGAYAAIKGALGIFSEILHFEARKYGINVTTVYPFMVNTPFYQDIKGETWGARLSMKLVPYYSMKPEKVAAIILRAIKREKKVETVSFLNEFGFYANFFPIIPDIMAMVSSRLLTKKVAVGGAQ
jgi:short-subunit dehydrogenase